MRALSKAATCSSSSARPMSATSAFLHWPRILVQRQVAVLAVPGSMALALAAKAATSTIPIVFMIGSDPVQLGLVGSLNRPGGNLTGVAYLNVEVAAKRFELLHKLVPAARSVALFVQPEN